MRLPYPRTETNIIQGDCLEKLPHLAENSVDLIFTSPPYANQRKSQYGGKSPRNYIDWFLPRSKEFLRVLKPEGSFVLNIKESVSDGERQTYVLELILALKEQGWFWVEEYIWRKTTSFPGFWPNRFRDGWERLLHFTKARKFKMNQAAVRVPQKASTKQRGRNLAKSDQTRHFPETGSKLSRRVESCCTDKELVLPDNVLELSPATRNRNHPAVFPETLPAWFISLFTDEGDLVLDPFAGIGTTGIAAARLRRNYLLIEIRAEYCAEAENNLSI